MPSRVTTPLWLGVALMLIVLNQRVPITSVPPVLDDIRAELGLSASVSGLLTSLPLLCFAVFGLVAPALARRWGGELVLLGCLGAIGGGVLVRLVPEVAPLLAGTLLLGIGIAVANVLVPAVIKRDYERPGGMMGVYTMTLNASGALGAGLAVPLEQALGGSWSGALALAAVPAVAAAALWVPATLRARRAAVDQPPRPRASLLRDPLAWQLTGLMAFQSTLFYSSIAWIPDILRDAGLSSGSAGFLLALVMVVGLPPALLLPVVAARRADQRMLVALAGVGWMGGLLGLLVAPGTATFVWMTLLGLAQGAGIALALTLIVLRAPDGEVAASLSAMVQSIGYLMAAAGPVLLGLVHDVTGGWELPVALMMASGAGVVACGLGAGRPRLVGARAGAPY